MQAKNSIAGVVIAGGRSLRFGGEKAVAVFAGKPMLQWAAERLMRDCGHVAVNARPGTEAAALAHSMGLVVLHDHPGDPDGPLSGVRAGLEWAVDCGASSLAVSPCDVPLLPDDIFARLLEMAGSDAALAETSDGLQPMCAVWPVAALPTIRLSLEKGQHPPVWRVLEQLGARRLLVDPARWFANVNTRDELAQLEANRYQG